MVCCSGCQQCIETFGSELNVLIQAPVEELAVNSSVLAEAIYRMRQLKVIREPGYDGKYGVISVGKLKEKMT